MHWLHSVRDSEQTKSLVFGPVVSNYRASKFFQGLGSWGLGFRGLGWALMRVVSSTCKDSPLCVCRHVSLPNCFLSFYCEHARNAHTLEKTGGMVTPELFPEPQT